MNSGHSAQSLAGFGNDLLAARAYSVFAMVPLRAEILRFALSRPEVSTAEVMAELELTRNGALQHLKRLKEGGLLNARRSTHPRGSGPITYWKADRAEITTLFESFLRHVLCET